MNPPLYKISSESPWKILEAYLAKRGDEKEIEDIHEYLRLKEARDQAPDAMLAQGDQERFEALKATMREFYFMEVDFRRYVDGDKSESVEAKDFARRLGKLERYLTGIITHPEAGLDKALTRTAEADARRAQLALSLRDKVDGGERFWKTENSEPRIAETFVTAVLSSLTSYHAIMTMAADTAERAVKKRGARGVQGWRDEYIEGLKRIQSFLAAPNEQEELSLIDLTYIIGEHRGATEFRGSTTGYYEGLDAFINGLIHTMPSQEKFRESVNVTHNCVDPVFTDIAYTTKLAFVNARHSLGLTRADVDFCGTALSTLSTIMRGYGIEAIDDRFKQYLHNTGDHSLRTCVTIASARDTKINRLKYIYDKKMKENPSAESRLRQECERQEEIANKEATRFAKEACLHDLGEFLNELLGNNLIGVTEDDESKLRRLRDQLENHVKSEFGLKEIPFRLGRNPYRWHSRNKLSDYGAEAMDIMRIGNAPKKGATGVADDDYDFDHKFYCLTFDVLERLNTNHDIITLRNVGKINREAYWQNAQNISHEDRRYTLQYALSKISGRKFKTTDKTDIAKYHHDEYERWFDEEEYNTQNATAEKYGGAKQYAPETTRPKELPTTSRPLDDYLSENDIIYEKSLFKEFSEVTKRDYEQLSREQARARQLSNEAMLYEICYDIRHYAKKHARIDPLLDSIKVKSAVDKIVAQGVAAAQEDLRKSGIELQYLTPAKVAVGKKRYRVGTIDRTTFCGGFFGNPKKPHQLFKVPNEVAVAAGTVAYAIAEKVSGDAVKFLRTGPHLMMLALNETVTEKDWHNLLERISHMDAAGDALLFTAGVAQKGLVWPPDLRSVALLNPLLEYGASAFKVEKEAVEKCYRHVLANFRGAIAEKYGISEEAMSYLNVRANHAVGDYRKLSSDVEESSAQAEAIYRYFSAQYDDRQKTPEINERFERAEKYMLDTLFEIQINNKNSDGKTSVSPAQIGSYEDKRLPAMRAARKKIGGNWIYNKTVDYVSEIRPLSIAAIGGLMATSHVGGNFVIPETHIALNTSLFFGGNLMLAGVASFAGSIQQRLQSAPPTNGFKRFWESFPQFEVQNNELYIIKGVTYKKAEDADRQQATRALVRLSQEDPDAFGKIADIVAASFCALVKPFDNKGGLLFTQQTTVASYDTAGTVGRNAAGLLAGGLAHPGLAVLQSASSAIATVIFARAGVLNLYMAKIDQARAQQQDEKYPGPDFNNVKNKIRKELGEMACEPLVDAWHNTGRIIKKLVTSEASSVQR